MVRGPPRGGPPPERTVGLSNITAPRLARRPNVANETQDSKDEVDEANKIYLLCCEIVCMM